MLTAAELHMGEPVPLYRVQETILAFCVGREDVTVFGAQAVNLYTGLPRMSQDVDLLARDPRGVAQDLADVIHAELHVATRVRENRPGEAYRVFQVHKDGNRHLADVRRAVPLDGVTERDGIRYVSLVDLVALKAIAFARRQLSPKGATDLADLRRLLLAHPKLAAPGAGVRRAIERLGGGEAEVEAWRELRATPLVSDEEADEGY